MLLFGHLGTTLGAAVVLEKLSLRADKTEIKIPLDYRLVVFGSMLPDIIDKPLVLMISDKPIGSARLVAHSLIFIVVLLLIGELLDLMYKKSVLLLIGCASFAHLIEDLIWKTPYVLFWPYYSRMLGYIKSSKPVFSSGYIENRVQIITASVAKLELGDALRKPSVFIPEIIGGIIILFFIGRLIMNKKLIYFLRTGKIR